MGNKYNPFGKTVRSVAEILSGLVNHPDNIHRREQIQLLCEWRLALVRHENQAGVAAMKAFEKFMNGETSPSLRALSLLSDGKASYRTTQQPERFIKTLSALKNWMDSVPLERRIMCPNTSVAEKIHGALHDSFTAVSRATDPLAVKSETEDPFNSPISVPQKILH